MNRRLFAIALTVAGLFHRVAHADSDPPIECFPSAKAVHEAHRGSRAVYTTHVTSWTESSKCWFIGKPTAKSPTRPRAVAPAPSQPAAQALPAQPEREVPAPHEENAAVQGTYEENAAALRSLLFGPDESPTDFEGRFSAVRNAPTFYSWRRCFATPVWDLCLVPEFN